ncbi:hypothetical protein MMC14_002969 [Varicellaria rhodocarpa]|nr:hypothetical protein [Varicellaria rhodocarpa]
MSHATATLKGKFIAEADSYETVEGNIYFPLSSIDQSVLTQTKTTTACPWKGTASYYTLTVDGQEYKDAAWSYQEPKDAAQNIKGHVAFYKNKIDIQTS